MKNLTMKFFLVLILTGTALSFSNAQPYKINIYNSYIFNDDIDAVSSGNNYFNGTVEGGYQWGLGLNI
ncbi:MAG: hypothetical protein IPL53_23655 [Ignavibacteria bacterium]|nr:hypothetical protein [Ignavibacteria bacterium]